MIPRSHSFWPRFGPALLTLAVGLAYAGLILISHDWNPMAFVRLGTRYGQGDPTGTIGYDGQFAYQIALNPLGATPYLDIPPYRYQRILYPLLARLTAFGQPSLIPWALLGLNIMALGLGTYVMSSLLRLKRLSPWYAIIAGIFTGQLASLRLDLNEPFALTFSLLAIYTFETARPRWGAIAFALAMLSKETAIAFVGGYLIYFLFKQRWRLLFETSLISLGPFALLQVAIWLHFGKIGLRSGGQGATSFSLVPFGGLLEFGLSDPGTLLSVLLILGPLIIAPCVALTISLLRSFPERFFAPEGLILALHILMMSTLPFSTYVDLPGVLRLTSGLVVATLVYAACNRSHKILRYSLLWLASIPLLVFLG